jgi:hypothetical protein
MGELSRTPSLRFVPSRKEVSDTVVDVIVDGPVCSLSAAIVEVGGPAAQKAVQFVARFRPWSDVAGNQEFTDFVLDPLHTLRGWASAQVPATVFSMAMWSERVSRPVEFHHQPLAGRVGDWRAGLGRSLCSPLTRSFVCECHNISTMPRFQPPPRRTQRANFWHYAPLLASPQSL